MFWKAALGAIATTIANDVILKPKQTALLARAYCDRVSKPLCQFSGASQGFLAVPAWGDVNLAPDAAADAPGREHHVLGNPYDLSQWPDQHFGAIVVVGVLEKLRRPDLALIEWRRVATKVFVVVPSWYSPLTWIVPSHKWVVASDLSKVWPTLFAEQDKTYLLPGPVVSDTMPGRWNTTQSPPSPSPSPESQAPMETPRPEQTSLRSLPPASGSTASSSSVSELMVLSGDDSEKSSRSPSTGGRSRSGT